MSAIDSICDEQQRDWYSAHGDFGDSRDQGKDGDFRMNTSTFDRLVEFHRWCRAGHFNVTSMVKERTMDSQSQIYYATYYDTVLREVVASNSLDMNPDMDSPFRTVIRDYEQSSGHFVILLEVLEPSMGRSGAFYDLLVERYGRRNVEATDQRRRRDRDLRVVDIMERQWCPVLGLVTNNRIEQERFGEALQRMWPETEAAIVARAIGIVYGDQRLPEPLRQEGLFSDSERGMLMEDVARNPFMFSSDFNPSEYNIGESFRTLRVLGAPDTDNLGIFLDYLCVWVPFIREFRSGPKHRDFGKGGNTPSSIVRMLLGYPESIRETHPEWTEDELDLDFFYVRTIALQAAHDWYRKKESLTFLSYEKLMEVWRKLPSVMTQRGHRWTVDLDAVKRSTMSDRRCLAAFLDSG